MLVAFFFLFQIEISIDSPCDLIRLSCICQLIMSKNVFINFGTKNRWAKPLPSDDTILESRKDEKNVWRSASMFVGSHHVADQKRKKDDSITTIFE